MGVSRRSAASGGSVHSAIGFHHHPDAIGAGLTDLARLVAIADKAVSGSLDHRRGRQSFPELAIKQTALGQMDPSRPMVLADRSIDRMERDGMNSGDRELGLTET